MMNLPGNLIRGAGSVVGGTVSAVGSVAGFGGRTRSDAGDIVVKEKSVLTVKETPVKDAPTTAALAIRTGFLMKRNEQGVWQRRFCCMVPHTFLYYFDNELSESPRGIIDLEYFTAVDIQSENIMKLSTPPYVNSRGFYFQIDDPAVMSEWMAAIHRDRYMVVRDERDAYQQLQEQFSGQMDSTTRMMEENGIEKERLTKEVAEGQKQLAEATRVLQEALDAISADEEDRVTVDVTNITENGALLKRRIEKMNLDYESRIRELSDSNQEKTNALQDRIDSLEQELEAEIRSKRMIEAQSSQDKRDGEHRLRDALSQLDKSSQSYQILWGVKGNLEDKLNVANEQKRVLIKEVKTLRKRVEDLQTSSEGLKIVNSKLESAVQALQQQVERLETEKTEKILSSEAATDEVTTAEPEKDQEGCDVTDALAIAATALSDSSAVREAEVTQERSQKLGVDIQGHESPHNSPSNSVGGVARSPDGSVPAPSILPPPPAPTDMDGNVIDWEVDRTNVLAMDWLSPEQRMLVEDRRKEEMVYGPDHEGKRLSIKNLATSIFHSDKDEIGSSHGGGSDMGSVSGAEKKSSLKRLSAIFTKGDTASPSAGHLPSSASVGSLDSSQSASDKHGVSSPPNESRTSGSAGAPTCYRCGGTVEGPKYSTCKCDIPQMTPEEESTGAIGQFKGFFSKGKQGIRKAGHAVSTPLGSIFSKHENSEHDRTIQEDFPMQQEDVPQHVTRDSSIDSSGGHDSMGGHSSSIEEQQKRKSSLLSLDEWLPKSMTSTHEHDESTKAISHSAASVRSHSATLNLEPEEVVGSWATTQGENSDKYQDKSPIIDEVNDTTLDTSEI